MKPTARVSNIHFPQVSKKCTGGSLSREDPHWKKQRQQSERPLRPRHYSLSVWPRRKTTETRKPLADPARAEELDNTQLARAGAKAQLPREERCPQALAGSGTSPQIPVPATTTDSLAPAALFYGKRIHPRRKVSSGPVIVKKFKNIAQLSPENQ
jgi:hypothetical protein